MRQTERNDGVHPATGLTYRALTNVDAGDLWMAEGGLGIDGQPRSGERVPADQAASWLSQAGEIDAAQVRYLNCSPAARAQADQAVALNDTDWEWESVPAVWEELAEAAEAAGLADAGYNGLDDIDWDRPWTPEEEDW